MRLVTLLALVLVVTVLLLILQDVPPVPPTGADSLDEPRANVAESPSKTALARVPLEPEHWFMGDARQFLEVRHKTTILEAVTHIDPTGVADLRVVAVMRRKPQPITVYVDVRSMILIGDTTYNLTLRPGDVLWFP